MTSTPLAHLLTGEPIDSPFPRSSETTIALLDWMADLNHGPNGHGPEDDGAAHVLHVLAFYLQSDADASDLLSTLRAAVAHEDEAERKAPSATTAFAAAQAIEQLHQALDDEVGIEAFYALLFETLPTPIHARYALSVLVERRERFEKHLPLLFRAASDRVFGADGISDTDRHYVDRIGGLLSVGDANG